MFTNRQIVIIVLRNARDEYFVHQRLPTKRVYPSLFGLGAGGSVEPGEAPADAAARELEEETGLVARPVPVLSFEFEPQQTTVHVFQYVTSATPRHDASEWSWSGWLPREHVLELWREGKLCPDTAVAVEKLHIPTDDGERSD